MFRLPPIFVLGIVVLLFAACGGDDPSDPDCCDGGERPGPPVPVAERMAALENLETEFRELLDQDLEPAALSAAIVAYLETRPEFMEVGVDETSTTVYAVFTDGRGLIIPNNLVLGDVTPGAGQRSARPAAEPAPDIAQAPAHVPDALVHDAPARAPQTIDPAELPASRRARLLHTFSGQTPFGNGAGAVNGELSLMLQQAGWQVTSGGAEAATVAGLRSVSGDGFFYLNTHGGPGKTWYGTRIEGVFALQTSTVVTPLSDTDATTEGDLDAGRLVYMLANYSGGSDDVLAYDMRYAITPSFVQHYMSFATNALVYLNACESGHPAATPAAMAAAFRAKGASVVLGWTRAVSAGDAWHSAMFLTDRMTGANRYEPEPSKHRAFPLDLVIAYMHERGIDVSGAGSLRVIGPASGAGFGLLRPTIERLQTDAEFSASPGHMTIHGDFGSDPGAANRSVFIRDGGTEVVLDVASWTPDSIRVFLVENEEASGFSGDVVVESRDRPSNPRRLHAWHGTAIHDHDNIGSLAQHIEMDFAGRFDVDSIRREPGDPAEANEHVQVFRTMRPPHVEARWTASGSAPMPDCTLTWSGSGTLSSEMLGANGGYVYEARLDPATRDFTIRNLVVADQGGMLAICGTSQQVPVSISHAYFIETGASDFFLHIDVNSQWQVQSRTFTSPLGDGLTLTLVWPTMSPMPAYDPLQPK